MEQDLNECKQALDKANEGLVDRNKEYIRLQNIVKKKDMSLNKIIFKIKQLAKDIERLTFGEYHLKNSYTALSREYEQLKRQNYTLQDRLSELQACAQSLYHQLYYRPFFHHVVN